MSSYLAKKDAAAEVPLEGAVVAGAGARGLLYAVGRSALYRFSAASFRPSLLPSDTICEICVGVNKPVKNTVQHNTIKQEPVPLLI